MINKYFLEEPNLIDLSKEIFKAVVRDKVEIDTRFELLSQDLYEADTINFILADGLGYKNLSSTDSSLNKNVTQSINTTATVVTETFQAEEKILPNENFKTIK